jgi:phenylalanyl-tRNA synthetase beta chain
VLGGYGQENDFYMLKGIVETLFDKIGIKGAEYEPEANHSTYHPGRCANILYKNEFLGIIGEIHPDVVENYDICPRVYICELDFDSMFLNAQTDRIYFSLPKYPAIDRDIAIVVEEKVYVREIENIILQNGGKILENVELFDIYRGKQVKEGYKSVAYSLTYRNAKKTLTDEEVNKVHSRIIKVLKEELGAELRE